MRTRRGRCVNLEICLLARAREVFTIEETDRFVCPHCHEELVEVAVDESDLSAASEVTQARVAEALKVGAETHAGELELEFLSRLSPSKFKAT